MLEDKTKGEECLKVLEDIVFDYKTDYSGHLPEGWLILPNQAHINVDTWLSIKVDKIYIDSPEKKNLVGAVTTYRYEDKSHMTVSDTYVEALADITSQIMPKKLLRAIAV